MDLKKEYYSIIEAAALLDCSVMDIINFGVSEKIRICIYLNLLHEEISVYPDHEDPYIGAGYKGFYSILSDDLIDFELNTSAYDGNYMSIFAIYPYTHKNNSVNFIPECCFIDTYWLYEGSVEISNLIIFSSEIDKLKNIDNKQLIFPDNALKGNPKSIDSLLKIIITMAKDGYRYDHTAMKSELPKEISEAAALLGLTITDDSVRKWLKKGAALLPQKED